MVNIMTIRNFRSPHSLKRELGVMKSHPKKTADGYYTASVLQQFRVNKHNQKPIDVFNKQDVTVYFIY